MSCVWDYVAQMAPHPLKKGDGADIARLVIYNDFGITCANAP